MDFILAGFALCVLIFWVGFVFCLVRYDFVCVLYSLPAGSFCVSFGRLFLLRGALMSFDFLFGGVVCGLFIRWILCLYVIFFSSILILFL